MKYFRNPFVEPSIETLLSLMPMSCKHLGTINKAHFVLRKLVCKDCNCYRAYYEDEDTSKPIEGFEFKGELREVLTNLLKKLADYDNTRSIKEKRN